ncbi:MAG TPA: DUF3021 domain-containing protein [Virgibacillus sp.]|nr:DUF3021 domain-containing protein [Virgibacillus sp.]
MIIELLKRATIGIAVGALFTFIFLTIMIFNHFEASVFEIWQHMLASCLIGIFFGWASLIFEYNRWSQLKKTIIHFSASIIFYFAIAISLQWIPITPFAIGGSIIAFIVAYSLYWTGFYLYFKRVEQSLNKGLQKEKKQKFIP